MFFSPWVPAEYHVRRRRLMLALDDLHTRFPDCIRVATAGLADWWAPKAQWQSTWRPSKPTGALRPATTLRFLSNTV